MSEKRFQVDYEVGVLDTKTNEIICDTVNAEKVVDLLNEQQATIEHLKKRLYDFEKRKIIEESEIDEDVIPKVKLLRAELFGEKYE